MLELSKKYFKAAIIKKCQQLQILLKKSKIILAKKSGDKETYVIINKEI